MKLIWSNDHQFNQFINQFDQFINNLIKLTLFSSCLWTYSWSLSPIHHIIQPNLLINMEKCVWPGNLCMVDLSSCLWSSSCCWLEEDWGRDSGTGFPSTKQRNLILYNSHKGEEYFSLNHHHKIYDKNLISRCLPDAKFFILPPLSQKSIQFLVSTLPHQFHLFISPGVHINTPHETYMHSKTSTKRYD